MSCAFTKSFGSTFPTKVSPTNARVIMMRTIFVAEERIIPELYGFLMEIKVFFSEVFYCKEVHARPEDIVVFSHASDRASIIKHHGEELIIALVKLLYISALPVSHVM